MLMATGTEHQGLIIPADVSTQTRASISGRLLEPGAALVQTSSVTIKPEEGWKLALIIVGAWYGN